MHMRRKRFEGHVRSGRQRSGERCPTHLKGWLAICPQWCKMRACPACFELKQVENLSNSITSRTERPKVVWKGINLFRSSEFYCTWKHHESEPSPRKAERLHSGIRGHQLALQRGLAPELRRLVCGVHCSYIQRLGFQPALGNLGQTTTSQSQNSPEIIVEVLASYNVPSKIAPLSSLAWRRIVAKNDKRHLIKLFPVLFFCLVGWGFTLWFCIW